MNGVPLTEISICTGIRSKNAAHGTMMSMPTIVPDGKNDATVTSKKATGIEQTNGPTRIPSRLAKVTIQPTQATSYSARYITYPTNEVACGPNV